MSYTPLKNTMVALTAVATMTVAGIAGATTANMDATASFLEAIALTPTDMQFGGIYFSAAPAGGDTVVLTTAGGITHNGNFSDGGGTVAAGTLDITGTTGQTIDITCDATATMTDGSGASIQVTNITYNYDTQGDTACDGAVDSYTLNTSGADALVGGTIDGATAVAFVAGSYSTANAGGDDIEFTVVYQ